MKREDTRSSQQAERSGLLLKAVDAAGAEGKVEVLAPRASQAQLEAALSKAATTPNEPVTQKLLQYGARPSRDLVLSATRGAKYPLLALYLRAPTSVDPEVLSGALTEAVAREDAIAVSMLAASALIKQQPELQAIQEASNAGKYELLLAVLLRCSSLSNLFLDNVIREVFERRTLSEDSRYKITEALLLAGGHGDGCSAALILAMERNALGLMDLFVKYMVDVNWSHAKAVVLAVKTGNAAFVKRVLSNKSLRGEGASVAMQSLPSNVSPDERQQILTLLLDAGASGRPVDDQLVLAVSAGDDIVVRLLRQKGALLDQNSGDALVEAVKNQQVDTLKLLLDGPVEPVSMSRCFPSLRRGSKRTRLEMTALLLAKGAVGDAVHGALRDAICHEDKEIALIDLLLHKGADPTVDHMQALRHVIAHPDVPLLRKLLHCPAGISSGQVSLLVHEVVKVPDPGSRLGLLKAIVEMPNDMKASENSIAIALCHELSLSQTELEVVELVVGRGNANVSYDAGKAVVIASTKQDPRLLQELMGSPHITTDACRNALKVMLKSGAFNDQEKAIQSSVLLNINRNQGVAYSGLKTFVAHCREATSSSRGWPMQTFDVLLGAKPDVNRENGAVIVTVVTSSCSALLQRILNIVPPSQPVIDRALNESMNVSDDNDAQTLCNMLLQAGPSQAGVSFALILATQLQRPHLCHILLHAGAQLDCQDHNAIRTAIETSNIGLVALFMASSPAPGSVLEAFRHATLLPASDQRLHIMHDILQAGVEQEAVDQYVTDLVTSDVVDMPLLELVLGYASTGARNSESLLFASTQKKLDSLELLWNKISSDTTADLCFEACLNTGRVRDHEADVLRFLLQKGVVGDLKNRALLEAVDLTTSPAVDVSIVDLLLLHGANANIEDGLALCRASEFRRLDIADLLCHAGASSRSRARALHFCLRSDPTRVSAGDFCAIIDLLPAPIGTLSRVRQTFAQAQTDFEPAAFVFLEKRPRHPEELKRVLDAGCNLTASRNGSDLFHWAITRNAPKVKTQCLQLLMEHGASARHVDADTAESMVILAIKTGRSSLLPSMLRSGVDASRKTRQGRSPLLLAVEKGDGPAVADLLAANVASNDGSLHQAIRNLAVNTVGLLLEKGHDPMLPSPFSGHARRTPLMQLIQSVQADPSNYHLIRQMVDQLMSHGAGVQKLYVTKPLICHGLDNSIHMAEAILLACLSSTIDEDFNLYKDEQYCYSPTMYVKMRVFLGQPGETEQKWALLKQYGAERDVYYAWKGEQPAEPVGMPDSIRKPYELKLAKDERDREEAAAHNLQLRRLKEAARVREQSATQAHQAQLDRSAEEAEQEARAAQDRLTAQLRHERAKFQEVERQNQAQVSWRQMERDNEYASARKQQRLQIEQSQEIAVIEQNTRRQLMLEDQQAMNAKVQAQRSLRADSDRYDGYQHER